MGHSSKKKKKGGGGGGGGKRNKGRLQSKDHSSFSAEENELLAEEITVLCAIFQEDCQVVPGSLPQIVIKLRPYTTDMGYEDLNVSALLSVRCPPGYPFKCPKLQITPEEGLTKNDADKLLSLLHDQANLNAREGRVMIFNLVEAAQEFLSEIIPPAQLPDSAANPTSENGCQLLCKDIGSSNNMSSSPRGPFVYGFVDLFSGCGESWHWGVTIDDGGVITSSEQSMNMKDTKGEVQEKKVEKVMKPLVMQDVKQGSLSSQVPKLDPVEEETEDESKSLSNTESNESQMEFFSGNKMRGENEDRDTEESETEDDDEIESEPWESESSTSLRQDQAGETIEKDLILVHLLRLACSAKGSLADSLSQIATELCNLGVISERVQELASKPSSTFSETFDQVFRRHMVSSRVSQFWKLGSDLEEPDKSLPSSRYLNDFEELQSLGHGGFGHVVLCKNKLDGRQYAVKKIRLKDKILPVNDRILRDEVAAFVRFNERWCPLVSYCYYIEHDDPASIAPLNVINVVSLHRCEILREVATLSRLQHQHVVRYYQAWCETGVTGSSGETPWGSGTAASSMLSYKGTSSADVREENKDESTYLYIQMEYCPRTLHQFFESYNHFDKDLAWHWFRQIVEGLAHIHGQGIIHRDLTPNNIFFDARNDVKIGDFGLAKFLKLEQLDPDAALPSDTTGVSIDGTGEVGTYFYTAPEIEQGWPKIDEKADMYSLGIVFFELWHPFGTAMERHIILSDLKQKRGLPSSWVAQFPEQASLLQRLMSPSPSDRPSATDLLKNAFPPRMEYELLDNMLRTMQTSDDRSVYDKVVNAIFDEEVLGLKNHHQHGRLRMVRDNSSIHLTELRDYVIEASREVFRQHCAKHLEVTQMHLLDDYSHFKRNTVKLLSHGGDFIELCHELRLPFVNWLIASQRYSFRRYEISSVYRRAVGHSPPNCYLQGDFDIVGGAASLTEAEVIKVTVDIMCRFFSSDSCDIRLNHGGLLEAIWSWVGIKPELRHKVAELLSLLGSLRPQSSERKLKWGVIRHQLLQELNLAEAVVNRLQTVGLRFCGAADQALPRLRGALLMDKSTRKALDELSDLFMYLRVWKIESHVYVDPLMPPTEFYHRDLYFQIYQMKENNPGSLSGGMLLAVGGRYDYLLRQKWDHDCASHRTNPPGCVGTSLALAAIVDHRPADFRPLRNDISTNILICSRGGGGLLVERMELVAELWNENIKAEFVPIPDPSMTEQYEYANDHDIKCIVIMTDAGVSKTGFVKVRHLELKKGKEVEREMLVRFLLDAMATQFRNPSVWI